MVNRGWKAKLRIGDVFHNDGLSFEQRRDAIVRRFRALLQAGDVSQDSFGLSISELVDELAETENPDEFDWVWDEIYDWADTERVWIETFSSAPAAEAER